MLDRRLKPTATEAEAAEQDQHDDDDHDDEQDAERRLLSSQVTARIASAQKSQTALGRVVPRVSDRIGRLEQAFAALNGGDHTRFEELFAAHGRWLGVPGSGIDGGTPI